MIYLSGTVNANLIHPRIGFMKQPGMGNAIPAGATWAADNGGFSGDHTPGGGWRNVQSYLWWLERPNNDRATCLFATARDVVGDHAATLELSLPMLPAIRELGYKAAFVAQDGWDSDSTPWDAFDVLFIGGTTHFKLGLGGNAISAAHRRGKPVHMGRVNSYKRLRLAAAMGCESADGTFIRFNPGVNAAALLRWLDDLTAAPLLGVC